MAEAGRGISLDDEFPDQVEKKSEEKKAQPEEVFGNAELDALLHDKNISLDDSRQYSSHPLFKSQLEESDIKLNDVKVTIFDLSKESDMKSFQELKTKASTEGSGIVITTEDRKFVEATGSWKLYVEWARIWYKLPARLTSGNTV
jgi:hypothetical protein